MQNYYKTGQIILALTLLFLQGCGTMQLKSTAPAKLDVKTTKLNLNTSPMEHAKIGSRIVLEGKSIGFTQSEAGSLGLGVAIPFFGAAANAAYVQGLTNEKSEKLGTLASTPVNDILKDSVKNFCTQHQCEPEQVLVDEKKKPANSLIFTPGLSLLLGVGDKDLHTTVVLNVAQTDVKGKVAWENTYVSNLTDVVDYQKLAEGSFDGEKKYNQQVTETFVQLIDLFNLDLSGAFDHSGKTLVQIQFPNSQFPMQANLLRRDGNQAVILTYRGVQTIDVTNAKITKL